jgi:hypothetical protein
MIEKMLAYEKRLWRNLFQWVARRPAGGPGSVAFGNTRAVMPIMWAFVVLSAVEIIAVDLIVSRWATVRTILLILGAYGLLWMLGLVATFKVHPHVLDTVGIRLRSGPSVDLQVPWSAVADARVHRRYAHGKGLRVDHGVATIAVMSETHVDIRLREQTTLPGVSEPVQELHVYADDPSAFAAAITERVAALASAAETSGERRNSVA